MERKARSSIFSKLVFHLLSAYLTIIPNTNCTRNSVRNRFLQIRGKDAMKRKARDAFDENQKQNASSEKNIHHNILEKEFNQNLKKNY